MAAPAGPMTGSRVSVSSRGFSGEFGVYPFHRLEPVNKDHVSVIDAGVSLTAVSGGFVDPGDVWLLGFQTTILASGGIRQTAEGVFT